MLHCESQSRRSANVTKQKRARLRMLERLQRYHPEYNYSFRSTASCKLNFSVISPMEKDGEHYSPHGDELPSTDWRRGPNVLIARHHVKPNAHHCLLSLDPSGFNPDSKRQRPMSEDSSKLSTILHWISIVIGPDAAVSLSCDVSSSRFTFYLSSNSLHDTSINNATRLLDILRKSLLIASTGGNQSNLEDEYLAFVTDACWHRLQDKINNKIPHFPLVPDQADVSTISSVLETIIGLVEAWNAWRANTGLPDEGSPKIMEMQRKLNHSQSFDTLKHCFEQVFHPLDDAADWRQQLHRLWHCCYALMTSNFFADVFNERWKDYYSRETCFLYRVYRRLWRLYFYRKGINVLLYGGIRYFTLTSITQESHPSPPDIKFCWVPRDSPSTVRMVTIPEQFIFQAGQGLDGGEISPRILV